MIRRKSRGGGWRRTPAPVAPPPEAPPQPREPLAPRLRAGAAAAVVYVALGLVVLHSVLPRFHTAYVGSGELEGWMWRYWWMKQLIAGAWQAGRPLYALYVALVSGSYPETGNVFDLQWFSVPLEALFGSPAYYNVKVLLFLVLNGMAAYWLARVLVRDWTASVLCGVAFGFGSYILTEIEAGRVRHVGVFPLALYALALMRLQQRPGSVSAALWAGLAFGLCTTMYLYYGMTAMFLTVLWLVALAAPSEKPARYALVVGGVALGLYAAMWLGIPPRVLGILFLAPMAALLWRLRSRWRDLLMVGAVAAMTSAPYATWYLEQTFVARQPLREVTYYQDFPPLDFLLNPQNVHATDDNLMNSLQRFRGDSVSWNYPFLFEYRRSAPLVFTGIVLLGLALFRRRPWLWIAAMLLGYVLTLGPYLRGGLTEEYAAVPTGILMPQALFFKYVPFFSRLFSPVRMGGLFGLGFGVVLAWAVACGFQRLRVAGAMRPLLLALVAVPLLAQMTRSSQIPLSYTPVDVPDVYPWLAAQKDVGVVELPFREGDYVNYYQMFHEKRVLEGWGSGSLPPGYPPGRTQWLGERLSGDLPDNPFLRYLRRLNDGDASLPYREADVQRVVGQGYRYAVLHERGCYIVKASQGHEHYLWMRDLLERRFGPPLRLSREHLRERGSDDREADDSGLYAYEIAVYDLGRGL